MVEAANLASVFQLTAGVSLAINVFRAPHDQEYQRLGLMLDAEETLLKGRVGAAVDQKVGKVADLRTDWIVMRKDLEAGIGGAERLIWVGVATSLLLLLFCSLWGDWLLAFWWASLLVLLSFTPIVVGISLMRRVTKSKLGPLKRQILEL